MAPRPTTTPSASTGRSTSTSTLRRRIHAGRGAAATDACGGPDSERRMSRTAFRAEDVLLLQTTRLRPQSSGGQRSPRRESTSSIDVVDGPERLVVPYADLMGRFRTDDAPALIRAARLDAGLSRVQLAQRAGLNESVLTQMESGARAVSDELLEVVLRAAGYRPSLPLAMQADKILACAESHGLSNLRVFGSSVRGEDDFDSDIDLLVTPSTSTDLFDLALFVDDVERLTGFPTDVVSDSPLPVQLTDAAREAVPL